MGAFAVTRGEFGAFVAATNYKLEDGCYFWTGTTWEERSDRSWQSPGFAQDDRHPVTCVDLKAAKAYVSWLSPKTGKIYRLPSETEREYVTRAGSTTPFWWGSSISTKQANYNGEFALPYGVQGEWRQRTVPVDSFASNPWGVYNAHGNVWDWTDDCWSEANAGNPGDGSARTVGDCSWRVVRGGAWNYSRRTYGPRFGIGTCPTTAAAFKASGSRGRFETCMAAELSRAAQSDLVHAAAAVELRC